MVSSTKDIQFDDFFYNTLPTLEWGKHLIAYTTHSRTLTLSMVRIHEKSFRLTSFYTETRRQGAHAIFCVDDWTAYFLQCANYAAAKEDNSSRAY